jgi:branched-chain amino acid transport system permease protein
MVDANLLLVQLLNGLALGLLYVLVSSGLTVIFGISGILNFAHGALFMLGAYVATVVVDVTGSFWIALVVAPVAVGILGLVIERSTLHYLYDRDVSYQILLTFGLTLMITDGVEFFLGSQRSFPTPEALAGPIQLGPVFYPQYRLFVMGAALAVTVLVWALFRFTDFGLIARAGAQNQGTVRILGIDISRYFTLVFGMGAALAGIAGVLAGPFQGVNSAIGNDFLLVSFIVVILGGLGSFRGAFVASILLGVTQKLGETFFPELAGYYIYLLLVGTLLIRPQGLFGNFDREALLQRTAKIRHAVSIDPVSLTDRRAVAAFGALAAFPVASAVGLSPGVTDYYVGVLTLILTWGVIALSLDIALGYLGLLSFGHAAFFGVGAYASGLFMLHVTNSLLLALVVSVVLTVAVAWVVGALSIRFTGVFFAMITLAIAQTIWQLSLNLTDLTGGTDGLQGVPAVEILGVPVGGTIPFFYVTLIAVVAMYGLAVYVLNSPFGRAMEAIREGERRAAFLGYDTRMYKRRALALSGGIAGVAGVLFAGSRAVITPNTLHWTVSGDALFGVLLGGMGTLYGPLIGGGLYAGMQQILSSFFDEWRFVVGLLLVLVVMFAPRGLVSIYGQLRRWLDIGGPGGPTPDVGDGPDPPASGSAAADGAADTDPVDTDGGVVGRTGRREGSPAPDETNGSDRKPGEHQ